MKIELSVKVTYLPDWGVREGIREFIQNAKDSETEGHPMEVGFIKPGILRIANRGTVLSHKVLLFGETTKQNREDQIGQFGEGLKVGTLALVRAGRSVTIRTGNEIWTPSIGLSAVFGEDVLIFNTKKSSSAFDGTAVDIALQDDEWEHLKRHFLFLMDVEKIQPEKEGGSILLDPEYAGKVYVKGIFITDVPNLKYGYDMRVKVDRDRNMVREYDLHYGTSELWRNMTYSYSEDNQRHFQKLVDLLEAGTDDVKNFEWSPWTAQSFQNFLWEWWNKRHGERAYPVLSESDVSELSHCNARGVMISSKSLANALWQRSGKPCDIVQKLQAEVTKRYTLAELNQEERLNYLKSMARLEHVLNLKDIDLRSMVVIVDFNSAITLGQFCTGTGEIRLARKIFCKMTRALRVLIHEVGHFLGKDGHHDHVVFLENAWEMVLEKMMEERNV